MNYELKGDLSIVSVLGTHHYILEGFIKDRNISYRTLGLKDFCGLDLEFNLSLQPSEAKRILDFILNSISLGIELKDNLITSDLTNAPVLVKKMKPINGYEKNEFVYRIIFSDEEFRLPTDERCSIPYKNQLI